jgi:hypothetical protein
MIILSIESRYQHKGDSSRKSFLFVLRKKMKDYAISE